MTEKNPPYLSITVPCYNEEEGLRELHGRLTAAAAPWADRGVEIIFVNDGSSDGTWKKILELRASDPRVRGLCLSRNFGHGMALTAGLDACLGERILIIDADLQDPPELLSEMMKRLDAGADVAYGKRIQRTGESLFKRLSAKLFYRLINSLSEVPLPVDTGDFRLIDRRAADALRSMPETARYIRGMVAWVGFKQEAVDYERKERFAGKTHYTLAKMLRFAMDALTGFSNLPLRLAFYFGFLMMAVSGMLLVYILFVWLNGSTVPGWTSLAFLIAASQGVQWFFLGLLGEYVGRIYVESKGRPKYIVAATT